MDTKNWFGEHAASIRLIALAGGIALAAIIILDILTHKKASTSLTNGAAPATGADTSPATSGTSATSTLVNPGETYISILEDYSSHVNNDTMTAPAGEYLHSRPVLHPITSGTPAPLPTAQSGVGILPPAVPGPYQPLVASLPSSPHGGPVPVPTPHPSTQYTVRRGDSLWSIAQRFLGNGANWRQLYQRNRGVVGSNPNLIYPGEVLSIN